MAKKKQKIVDVIEEISGILDEYPGEWRVGRKLGRTIYCNDMLMGMMDDMESADLIVKTLNALPSLLERCRDAQSDQ